MGCAQTKVIPQAKERYPNIHNMSLDKSPSNDQTALSKTQLADLETLKNFNIMPAHFIRKNSGRVTDDYNFLSPPLGRGAFGEVRKALHNASGLTRAIKIIARRHADKEQEEVLLNEVNLLKSLDHPYIMKILEFYKDKNFFYIVSEYCGGGDLYERMKHTTFSESKAARIMGQIFQGVNYLHLHGVVHRDLKPENILHESANDDSNIKIGDFGVSRALKKGTKLHSTVGTILYIAPEVLKNSYNEKCDIWSCGVILYSMLYGRPPFYGRTEAEVEEKILRGVYSFSGKEGITVSKEAKSFIQKLLAYNPQDRYGAQQALKDPWMVKLLMKTKKLSKKNLNVGKEVIRNLATFHAGRKFQDAVWVFLCNYFLAEGDKKKLMQVFSELDTDNDGLIKKEELLKGFEKFNMLNELGEDSADEILDKIDRNKNGSIEYSEFVIATVNRKKLLAKSNLEATFKLIDKDENKSISMEELKEFFTGQGSHEWDDQVFEALIREVDENNDGEISYSEFKNMMYKML